MIVSEFTQSGDNQHKTMRRSQHLLYVCVCVCVCGGGGGGGGRA